jgi:integrase
MLINGLTCIEINDNDDKKLKNATAKRIIPVHSILIDHFDFLRFVAHQRSFSKRLFPALHKIDGCYGHAFSKMFKTYREKCGVVAPGMTFHSFRHLMADSFKNLNIPVHVAADILGHTIPGMTYGHYGKETTLAKMSEAIEQLQFFGVLQRVYIQ